MAEHPDRESMFGESETFHEPCDRSFGDGTVCWTIRRRTTPAKVGIAIFVIGCDESGLYFG